MHGHTRDICYRLVGYPADWKFKKKNGVGGSQMNTGKRIANHVCIERDNRDESGIVSTNYGSAYSRQRLASNMKSYDGSTLMK